MAKVIASFAIWIAFFLLSSEGVRIQSFPTAKDVDRGSHEILTQEDSDGDLTRSGIVMKRLAPKGGSRVGKTVLPSDSKANHVQQIKKTPSPRAATPTTPKPGSRFVDDFYDVEPNADSKEKKVASDYEASILEGNPALSRKTKIFEADYVDLGFKRSRSSTVSPCPSCRVLNVVISDITNGKRKVLSDATYTLM